MGMVSAAVMVQEVTALRMTETKSLMVENLILLKLVNRLDHVTHLRALHPKHLRALHPKHLRALHPKHLLAAA